MKFSRVYTVPVRGIEIPEIRQNSGGIFYCKAFIQSFIQAFIQVLKFRKFGGILPEFRRN
jgi:hypothetical protein